MKIRNIKTVATISKHNDDLFERDIWKAEEIGFKPDSVNGVYQLNFRRLKQSWFKQAVKKFIHFQAATKSLASCFSYLGRLTHFSEFIAIYHPNLRPAQINRDLMVQYIHFLAMSNLGIVTRGMALIHFRTFHTIMIQEKWLPMIREMIIYPGDIPKNHEHVPKYIPEYVIKQLLNKLYILPEYMQHLVTVLLETGRRLSEVVTLPLECMEQDDQGDYFLKVVEKKMKRSYLIPISDLCIKTIKAQQVLVCSGDFKNMRYLFPTRVTHKTQHVSGRYVNHALTELARDHKIVDEHGKIWRFHSHQFRHTVGTRMINAGVAQSIVQKYLGHESPEMTAKYAHIHNETLKTAFNQYQGKLVDINGKIRYRQQNDDYDEAKWGVLTYRGELLPL